MSRPATEEIYSQETVSKPEVIFLLEHVTGKTVTQMILEKHVLTEEEDKTFREMIEKRESGIPLQLIIGNVYFLDFKLEVRPGVFIPRPETEQLVEAVFAKLSSPPGTIIEIGTGTGAIAIALARQFPRARVTATDISVQALNLARKNAQTLGVGDRIRFIRAELLDFPEAAEFSGKVDLLVSNPPYIPEYMIKDLPAEVRDFDPLHALKGGQDGFAVLRSLLNEIPRFLAPTALAAFEIDPILEKPIKSYEEISDLNFSYGVDNYRNLRFLFVRRK